MLRPTAIKITALDDYKLNILFDNQEQKILDVKPFIKGDWYGELNDINYFKKADVDGFTIVWPNGQDLCPDEIYFYSVPSTQEL